MQSTPILLRIGSLIILAGVIAGCTQARTTELRSDLGEVTAMAHNSRIVVNGPGEYTRRLNVSARQILLARLRGRLCLIVLLNDRADTVRIYEVNGNSLAEKGRGIPQSLKPWKIQVGDVDGDGEEDIGVGVYKKARFHPVMAKRPFIYNWDGRHLSPKWLGSRLSRPFTDFVLADSGSGTKLVAIEETSDGSRELAVYKWNGFGFTRIWNGVRSEKLSELNVTGLPGKQMVVVYPHTSHKSYRSYSWDGRMLKEVR